MAGDDPFKLRRLRALVMVTFGFSRSEARAFLILLPLIFIIVFIQPICQALFPSRQSIDLGDAQKLDSLLATFKWPEHDSINAKPRTLFRFNPNEVTLAEMDSLGIQHQSSQRIDRYRKKGGRFKIKSDLQRIYGFDSALFATLEPYINLPSRLPMTGNSSEKKVNTTSQAAITPIRTREIFDLNVADTITLDGVYGIGPAIARRIVAYRERLGGFIREEQLFEIWGLDSAVAFRAMEQAVIAEHFEPRRININTADEKELAGHPYMKPKMARQIVTYRFQHGKFSSIEDLGKIYSFEPKTFERIKPYLTLE